MAVSILTQHSLSFEQAMMRKNPIIDIIKIFFIR